MDTSDKNKFFRTEASHAEDARKEAKAGNKYGNPIVMKSKILAAVVDPAFPSDGIFIAESAGSVRRISLATGATRKSYRGPTAPVTCVALGGPGNRTVFAGSWDKDIYSWDIESGKPGPRFTGHGDFVKAVVCARLRCGRHLLVSGGADRKMMVWDAETGRRLHVLQDPATSMMAVQALAVDPVLSSGNGEGMVQGKSEGEREGEVEVEVEKKGKGKGKGKGEEEEEEEEEEDSIVVVSASSDPHIRRWRISLSGAEQITESFHDRPEAERLTIEEHRTSVYSLYFAAEDGDGDCDDGDCDLFTTDADGLAKCLSRARNFVAEDVFEHGDYLRAVVATDAWVVTAGRDEDVKVWDRASGELHCTLEGHYDEVTGLVVLRDARGRPQQVCSVGIDGTIRTWPLDRAGLDAVVREMEEARRAAAEGEGEGEKEGSGAGGDETTAAGNVLTAEEEAELAELMADGDD